MTSNNLLVEKQLIKTQQENNSLKRQIMLALEYIDENKDENGLDNYDVKVIKKLLKSGVGNE